MNFLGTTTPLPKVKEFPRLMFFDRRRNLADRCKLSTFDYGNDPPFSPCFTEAIRDSRSVWVVDRYLSDEPDAAEEIFYNVTDASVVQTRIITSKGKRWERVKQLAEDYNGQHRRTRAIEIGFLPSRDSGYFILPHDRFAILDEVLWHWGATVGGGFSGTNACSYGWNCNVRGVSTWFDKLWEAQKDEASLAR